MNFSKPFEVIEKSSDHLVIRCLVLTNTEELNTGEMTNCANDSYNITGSEDQLGLFLLCVNKY